MYEKRFCWEARVPAATAESVNENYFVGLESWWTSGSALMRRQSSWERKLKLYCPLFRTPLAWWPNFYGFSYFGTQIIGGCRRHTVTSAAMTIWNQLGYEHYSNCSAHCTQTSTLPLIWIRFADENGHYHRQVIAFYHGIDEAHFCWERIWLVWSCSATSVHSVQ